MLRRFLSDPLMIVLVITFLPALFYHKAVDTSASNTILVNTTKVAEIRDNFQQQYSRLPTKAELTAMVDRYVAEESMYREAQRLGLGEADPVIRRRYIQLLQFVQQEFDETKHAEFCEAVIGDTSPVTQTQFTFKQVYFRDKPPEVFSDEHGDAFPLDVEINNMPAKEVETYFGAAILHVLSNVRENIWQGPFASPYGFHFVRLAVKREVPLKTAYVQQKNDCMQQQRHERISEQQQLLRERHRVLYSEEAASLLVNMSSQ